MSVIGEWEKAEPGVQRKIFPPGKQVMMMEVHFKKGAQGKLHKHPHEQLTYCKKGSFEFTISGERHIIHEGETLVIPGDEEHGAVALEPGILLDTFTPLRQDLLK
ncbi:cupin domain-containing protein [Alteribacillus sp. HJP-4]|uniref:cupin domain-containing protein n=1 Tax=Alteribacillus sp. HJP-4 TaxID=2775394 RepID=UPI0035CD1253